MIPFVSDQGQCLSVKSACPGRKLRAGTDSKMDGAILFFYRLASSSVISSQEIPLSAISTIIW